MRTFHWWVIVMSALAFGIALNLGLIAFSFDNAGWDWSFCLEVHPQAVSNVASATEPCGSSRTEALAEAKGLIAAVRADKGELVVTENVKDLTFKVSKDAKIFINSKVSMLADLRPGDEAIVVFTRQGQELFASEVRSIRKKD